MLELDCAASPGDCAPSGSILPSLVLIGTRKAGTTALSNLLREHPRVLMPDCSAMRRLQNGRWPSGMCVWDKEVRYFSRGLRQHLDLCWYRSLYRCPVTAGVGRSMDASVQFKQGRESPEEEQYVGFDGSPDYLVIDESSVALMRSQLGSRTRLVAAQNIDGEARRRSHARKQRRTKGAPRGADFDRKSRSQKRRA